MLFIQQQKWKKSACWRKNLYPFPSIFQSFYRADTDNSLIVSGNNIPITRFNIIVLM